MYIEPCNVFSPVREHAPVELSREIRAGFISELYQWVHGYCRIDGIKINYFQSLNY